MSKPKILIIGAGAAGISAAAKLLEHGFTNLTILEAENRIGGRIHSVAFDGGIVDLGAQWCHGQEDNIVYNTVKDLNLLSSSQMNYDEFTLYESSGRLIESDISNKLFQIAFKIGFDKDALKVAKGSFGDYFISRYNKEIEDELSNNEDYYNIAKKFLDLFQKLIICLDSAPTWFDISAKRTLLYKQCEGDNYLNWKDKGYMKILHVLMKIYPNPDNALPFDHKIIYEKQVYKILWGGGSACITCTDGTIYKADHVIVTVSLGVLKQNYKTLFEPELPLEKQNAIQHIGYGCVKKVFLSFPHRWWPDDCSDFNLIWTEQDSENILNEFPNGPNYNGRSWLEDIMGFYVVDHHPRVLLVWIVGRLVNDIESLTDDVIIDGCMFLLKKFVGNKYDIPIPCDILRSYWDTNPHFYGAYSYQSPDSEKHNVFSKHLEEPLSVGDNEVVLFAGEATHSHYFSTVHGAIETGFREAKRIIDKYTVLLYRNLDGSHHQIAIIGAGMAGLGAARTFIEAGCKEIIILEAQSIFGGRVQTVSLEDGFLDLGAQWIHGTDNALYCIAAENNLLSPKISIEGLGLYVRDDGYIFDDYLVKRVDFEIGKILEECEKFVGASTFPYSIGDFLEKHFMQYLAECEDDIELKSLKLELFDWHLRFQAIDNSCGDLKQLSAKNWGKYSCLNQDYGQQYINLKSGYRSLLEAIMLDFPQDVIKYDSAVSKVSWKLNNMIKLEYNNDVVYCNHVIITASLGVLKEESIIFEPHLPNNVSRALDVMGYCAVGKIFLIFDKKWWDSDGFQFIWRKDAQLSSESSWTRNITGFDTVVTYPNVLLGWVGGRGVGIMEDLSNDVVGLHCVEVLQKFLQRSDIPYPKKVVKSKWLSNKWIQGGYGYITPECDNLGISSGTLLEPVFDGTIPRILFAGEAVHPSHFSTTHGAFESGQQQAKFLLNYLEGRNT